MQHHPLNTLPLDDRTFPVLPGSEQRDLTGAIFFAPLAARRHHSCCRAEKMTVGALLDIIHGEAVCPWTHFLRRQNPDPRSIYGSEVFLAFLRRSEKITALAEEGESGKFEKEDGE